MDLSSQNDGSDSIFMAGNIDAKREFERISHKYSNVKRFYNPLDEALLRVQPIITGNANNIRKKSHNDAQSIAHSSSDTDHKDEDDLLFTNYDKNLMIFIHILQVQRFRQCCPVYGKAKVTYLTRMLIQSTRIGQRVQTTALATLLHRMHVTC